MFPLYGLHFDSIQSAINFGKGSIEYIRCTIEYRTYRMTNKLSGSLIPHLKALRQLEK